MKRKFSIKNIFSEALDETIEEIEQEKEGELDESESDSDESKKKSKRKKRKKIKSPLKEASNKRKKERKNGRPRMVGFIGTLLLMLVVLFVYSLSFLLAPTHTLVAQISVVRGGYNLTYDICEMNLSLLPEDIDVGDTFYVTSYGSPANTSKNSILMKVISVDGDVAKLDFVAEGFPTFISTSEMKNIIKTTESGKTYTSVLITGKVVANKFSLMKIHT